MRPGLTVERIVSAIRQRARKVTYENMVYLLTPEGKQFLDDLLAVEEDDYRTSLSWLQRMPTDHTATQLKVTLDKIRFLQDVGIAGWELDNVNPNRLDFSQDL